MQKRGQFYLAAAVIMVVILAGILVITNSATKRTDNELSNLQKEINVEIEKTFNYCVNNSLDDDSTKIILENLSTFYINKTGTNKNSLFMFGDRNNLTLKGYRMNNSGNFLIDPGSDFENITAIPGFFENSFENVAANITIKDNSNLYGFKMQEGQSFYYLISKNISEEEVIIRN